MLRCAATRQGSPTVTLTGGGVDMLLRGLRAAQVVENQHVLLMEPPEETLALVAGWITTVSCALPMSPLTVVFWRTQRVVLVAWAPADVIAAAANAPFHNRCGAGGGVS